MKIALIAETLERADLELRSLVEANSEDLQAYDRQLHLAVFKDGAVVKAVSIPDMVHDKVYPVDQIFTTRDCLQSAVVDYYRRRIFSLCCIPEEYIVQVLED